ncbi:hypothetical protein [Bradyrhizobium cytisi]|uniref:Uncharacterized protein n=1 Tax=Bradyrhizobium cytisi TaxID=515489 RepID=A0A5S4VT38_9BRAD|nr:hypothetical protein [Bradyrhizobium cytisi]TYL70152.1 hypothetical protein FXB38_42040 [Bradyrhizobium cytisi]
MNLLIQDIEANELRRYARQAREAAAKASTLLRCGERPWIGLVLQGMETEELKFGENAIGRDEAWSRST